MVLLRILKESFLQAADQLVSNKLRSFLTLLGITIGVFCIIAVLSSVDSLEENLVQSFNKLGSDVLYVTKMPWEENPGQSYWKYAARPNAGEEDLQAIEQRSKLAEKSSLMVFIPGKVIKYRNNNAEGAYISGITDHYGEIIDMGIESGRYFTPNEFHSASNKVILGNAIAKTIFNEEDPLGKEIKIYGQYFQVIGVLALEGASLIKVFPFDQACFIPWNTTKKLISLKTDANWGTMLNVKVKSGVELKEAKYELAGILRPVRGLKPLENANFAINEISILTTIIQSIFKVVNVAGIFIGLFAMLVGAFSVANIMFVSVKERTNLIGIKMAVGAKRYFILLEFLFEAIVLCIIGGLMGLGFVWIILKLASVAVKFDMFLSLQNVLIGVLISIGIGILSGIIPAIQASRLDPVEAIRK